MQNRQQIIEFLQNRGAFVIDMPHAIIASLSPFGRLLVILDSTIKTNAEKRRIISIVKSNGGIVWNISSLNTLAKYWLTLEP